MNEGGISAIAQGYENLGKGTMAQKGLDLNRTWSNKINTGTQSGFLYGIWEAFVYDNRIRYSIIDQSEGRSGMYFDEVKKNFGFGCMRLPMMENGTDVDLAETTKMVDIRGKSIF